MGFARRAVAGKFVHPYRSVAGSGSKTKFLKLKERYNSNNRVANFDSTDLQDKPRVPEGAEMLRVQEHQM